MLQPKISPYEISDFTGMSSNNNHQINKIENEISIENYSLENQEINEQKSFNDCENQSKTEENWMEKYKKFLKRTSFKSLSKPVLTPFEFTRKIIEEINNARMNLKKYSEKIDQFSKCIETDKFKKEKYLVINEEKIFLPKNYNDFEECSKYMKELHEEMKSKNDYLKKLTYISELKFPIPKKDLYHRDIDLFIKNLREKNKGIYNISNYIYFKSSNDPEISTMLQFVDHEVDIRKILLNSKIRFIGVNYLKNRDGTYIVYLLFAS